MSTVAFLASVVDPRVASSAAKAALGERTEGGALVWVLVTLWYGCEKVTFDHFFCLQRSSPECIKSQ